jgi:Tetratricopeptide repeat/Glycosyltransferase family 9 (heptosyltransferase)
MAKHASKRLSEADVSARVGALYSRGYELMRLKRYEEALAAFEAIVAIKPNHLGALNGIGGVLTRLGRPESALTRYDRALAAAPRTVELHVNKGTALVALNRFEDAMQCFLAAIAIEPGRAEAHYNASLVMLRLGDFASGWREFEWRWRKADWADKRRDFAAALWLGGEPIEGKTILLHAEQGLGDTIQFVRYVPLVAARGATVILECQPELKNLLRIVEGTAGVFARGEALPPFDSHCPLMSLPLACTTELETVPTTIPYLRPRQDWAAKWQNRLPANGRLRVGLCWAGSPVHLNDRNRSIPLERLVPALGVSGLDFVSLQKDVSETQANILRNHCVTQLGQEFTDFADTAALLSMLDLVITVDTSIAHLAGAMGKAVALLVPFSPDFRWMLDRTDSPWYPTMRLFRQTAIGDWDGPLERLRQELSVVARRPVKTR